MTKKIFIIIALLLFSDVFAGERLIYFRDDFNSLENWTHCSFPNTVKESDYTIENSGEKPCLRAGSSGSASGLILNKRINVYEYPSIKWRWKVSNVYKKGEHGKKEGDDYPIRIYILFEYNPETATLIEKAKYELGKKIYGFYPPKSSIEYVWANTEDIPEIVPSPYNKSVRIFSIQKGKQNVGTWQEQERNILDDYRRVFNMDPPLFATIGIMNDSDNTGESSVSHVDYIEVFR
jgi:hypothetical protein